MQRAKEFAEEVSQLQTLEKELERQEEQMQYEEEMRAKKEEAEQLDKELKEKMRELEYWRQKQAELRALKSQQEEELKAAKEVHAEVPWPPVLGQVEQEEAIHEVTIEDELDSAKKGKGNLEEKYKTKKTKEEKERRAQQEAERAEQEREKEEQLLREEERYLREEEERARREEEDRRQREEEERQRKEEEERARRDEEESEERRQREREEREGKKTRRKGKRERRKAEREERERTLADQELARRLQEEEDKNALERERRRLEVEEAQQERFRRLEEEIKRRAAQGKMKRQDSSGFDTAWTSSASSSSPLNTGPSPSSGLPRSPPACATSTTFPTYRNGVPPTQAGQGFPTGTGSAWSTGTSALTTPHSSGSENIPQSEAEWAQRHAEHARQQQEKLRQEQESLARRRAARNAANLTKDEMAKLFEKNEKMWPGLSSKDTLRWTDFPWPVTRMPSTPEDITILAVKAYILSPLYPDKSRSEKDRIKDYIRRWNPDRLQMKIFAKVLEEEKVDVREGVGAVVRSLVKLLRVADRSSAASTGSEKARQQKEAKEKEAEERARKKNSEEGQMRRQREEYERKKAKENEEWERALAEQLAKENRKREEEAERQRAERERAKEVEQMRRARMENERVERLGREREEARRLYGEREKRKLQEEAQQAEFRKLEEEIRRRTVGGERKAGTSSASSSFPDRMPVSSTSRLPSSTSFSGSPEQKLPERDLEREQERESQRKKVRESPREQEKGESKAVMCAEREREDGETEKMLESVKGAGGQAGDAPRLARQAESKRLTKKRPETGESDHQMEEGDKLESDASAEHREVEGEHRDASELQRPVQQEKGQDKEMAATMGQLERGEWDRESVSVLELGKKWKAHLKSRIKEEIGVFAQLSTQWFEENVSKLKEDDQRHLQTELENLTRSLDVLRNLTLEIFSGNVAEMVILVERGPKDEGDPATIDIAEEDRGGYGSEDAATCVQVPGPKEEPRAIDPGRREEGSSETEPGTDAEAPAKNTGGLEKEVEETADENNGDGEAMQLEKLKNIFTPKPKSSKQGVSSFANAQNFVIHHATFINSETANISTPTHGM
ncbi:hypothetical protein EST38_g3116 [Candolleomyces aberdarensis]|uniref:Uncharacterized protein n=1 Tax=Candolleomyces aberdarensis TaxID=2316362 RepID=A0A4Q2DT04_9AGAR|nr:hypothetical protein EST38_g3116 [Candolleomyces aberdarensis]